jgi:hypothetical protein
MSRFKARIQVSGIEKDKLLLTYFESKTKKRKILKSFSSVLKITMRLKVKSSHVQLFQWAGRGIGWF